MVENIQKLVTVQY